MLPTFLIIGAMKAGTSSLHRYLAAHPQVFMSGTKELNFFVPVRNWHRGLEWYEAQFAGAGDALAIGESSPSYTMNPVLQGVPEAIASVLPDVKLIYLIASRYAHQLHQYLRVFDRQQLLVVEASDLRDRRDEVYDRVCRFLGVATGVRPEVLRTEAHRSADKRVPTAVGERWRRGGLPQPRAVRRLLARPLRPEEITLDPAVERWLQLHLQPDLEQLVELLGDGFDAWGLLDPELTAASWEQAHPHFDWRRAARTA